MTERKAVWVANRNGMRMMLNSWTVVKQLQDIARQAKPPGSRYKIKHYGGRDDRYIVDIYDDSELAFFHELKWNHLGPLTNKPKGLAGRPKRRDPNKPKRKYTRRKKTTKEKVLLFLGVKPKPKSRSKRSVKSGSKRKSTKK